MTLNKILKSFNKTLVQLENFMEDNDRRISINGAKIAEYQNENLTLSQERDQAARIADNIKELIK